MGLLRTFIDYEIAHRFGLVSPCGWAIWEAWWQDWEAPQTIRVRPGYYRKEHYLPLSISLAVPDPAEYPALLTKTCEARYPQAVCPCGAYKIQWEV